MIIGLTGGIATGKSNVSHFLMQHRYQIVDADKITHKVQAKGQPGLKAIIHRFGPKYLTATGSLDRKRLGQWVFSHPHALKTLVRVIDPFIRQAIIQEIDADLKHSRPVVLDAPTLFESGYQYLVDQIWVVACDSEVQLARLRSRDHLSISEAQARMNSQWPLLIKEALADVVINSNGSKNQTLRQVKELIEKQR